eukprot:403334826
MYKENSSGLDSNTFQESPNNFSIASPHKSSFYHGEDNITMYQGDLDNNLHSEFQLRIHQNNIQNNSINKNGSQTVTQQQHQIEDSTNLNIRKKEFSSISLNKSELAKLQPEEWRNIPQCVVHGFKIVIDTNEVNEQNLKGLNQKTEQIKSRFNTQFQRVEKDILRRDENLRNEIRQVQQCMRSDIDLRFQEVNQSFEGIQSQHERIQQMFQMSIDGLNVKLEKIIQDQSHLKLKTQDVVKKIIKGELEIQYESVNQRFLNLEKEINMSPSLNGYSDSHDQKSLSIKDYFVTQIQALSAQLTQLELQQERCMTKNQVSSLMQTEVTILNEKINKDLQPILNDVVTKVNKDILQQIERQEQLILKQREKVKKLKIQQMSQLREEIKDIDDKYEDRIEALKQKVSEMVNEQLEEYQKAQALVQEKCFTLDCKIDQIQSVLDGNNDSQTLREELNALEQKHTFQNYPNEFEQQKKQGDQQKTENFLDQEISQNKEINEITGELLLSSQRSKKKIMEKRESDYFGKQSNQLRSPNRLQDLTDRITDLEKQMYILINGDQSTNDLKINNQFKMGMKRLFESNKLIENQNLNRNSFVKEEISDYNGQKQVNKENFNQEEDQKIIDPVDIEFFSQNWMRPKSGFKVYKDKKQILKQSTSSYQGNLLSQTRQPTLANTNLLKRKQNVCR